MVVCTSSFGGHPASPPCSTGWSSHRGLSSPKGRDTGPSNGWQRFKVRTIRRLCGWEIWWQPMESPSVTPVGPELTLSETTESDFQHATLNSQEEVGSLELCCLLLLRRGTCHRGRSHRLSAEWRSFPASWGACPQQIQAPGVRFRGRGVTRVC